VPGSLKQTASDSNSRGTAAGIVAGTAAGIVAGTAAGIVAGTAAGIVAETEAGIVAGTAAGIVAGMAAGSLSTRHVTLSCSPIVQGSLDRLHITAAPDGSNLTQQLLGALTATGACSSSMEITAVLLLPTSTSPGEVHRMLRCCCLVPLYTSHKLGSSSAG
jgi:hypothetical protein